MQDNQITRKATSGDVAAIHELLAYYGRKQLLLPRSENDIIAHLANFIVAECESKIIGTVALRDFKNGLYEIRSLAVAEEATGQGLGSELVRKAVASVSHIPKVRIFALTHHPNIFFRLGFVLVDKNIFPEKIWADCAQCPKIEHCDEVAVLCQPG